MGFSKIEAVVSMSKLTSLIQALSKIGVSGLTVYQAMGCGTEKGTPEYETEIFKEMALLPKEMMMLVVEDQLVDEVVELIKRELYTGHIGDGKIFVSPVSNIIRVRTGEEGMDALN